MPTYTYRNPLTNDTIEVIQSMNEPHVYETDGVTWQREFSVPNASIDTIWDSMNPKDFVEKTRNKRGTLGDLYDKAEELSKQREKIVGKDTVKEKAYKKYEKETGKRHPFREKKSNFSIDLTKKTIK